MVVGIDTNFSLTMGMKAEVEGMEDTRAETLASDPVCLTD